MKRGVCLLIVIFVVCSAVTQQETYKAAVLEHAPKNTTGNTLKQNLEDNVQDYIHYIQQAAFQDVQILVFPEYGLTGWVIVLNDFEEISTEVPDPKRKIAPCQSSSIYAKFLVDLSCAVQKYKIYTVVNLIESRHDPNKKKNIYHNTNVVFDRNGIVIARYRKVNLFDEFYVESGPSTLCTFKTDFGVTFGTFICFDIAFKSPAVDILMDPSVTDIVYPVAWLSQLPFYHANSMQHGYAKSNGVNLLAAGLNDPTKRNGGSGIYLADGRILETYISGEHKSKLIIQSVSKLRSRKDTSNFCQGSSGSPFHANTLKDANLFPTAASDLSLYTFKTLNLDNQVTSERICSGKSDFCCNFHIVVDKHSSISPNYVYKLVAFYGVTPISMSKTIGLRNCGVVACLNGSNQSCGGRNLLSPTGVSFESISVNGTFNIKSSHYQPSTLKSDLTPATDYMYCTQTSHEEEINIKLITTKRHDSLLSFGIIGRVYNKDDMAPGLIGIAQVPVSNIYIISLISVFVFILQ